MPFFAIFFQLRHRMQKPSVRFELTTPGLQDQCSNHWATKARYSVRQTRTSSTTNNFVWIEFEYCLHFELEAFSRVAQRKRAGPITQRSVDRNHPLLRTNFSTQFSKAKYCDDQNLIKIPVGPVRESNPGPRAPEARIIPLDQQAIAVSDWTKETHLDNNGWYLFFRRNCAFHVPLHALSRKSAWKLPEKV